MIAKLGPLCLAFLLLAACSKSPSSQSLNKAKQWLELNNPQNAQAEIAQAIQDDPKNVDARILLARSFLMEADHATYNKTGFINNALGALAEADQIDAGRSETSDVRTEAYTKLNACAQDANLLPSVLATIRNYPSKDALPSLDLALASIDRTTAFSAFDQELKIDDVHLKQSLINLMNRGSLPLQYHAAELLWTWQKYEPAKAVYLRLMVADLASAQDTRHASELVRNIVALDYPNGSDALLGVVGTAILDTTHAAAALPAMDALAQHGDQRLARIARDTVARIVGTQKLCSNMGLGLVWTLMTLKDPTNVPPLRSHIGELILGGGASSYGIDNKHSCLGTYLDVLAANDDPAWRNIVFAYPGWGIFDRMIPGRLQGMRSRFSSSSEYAGDQWDLVAPNAMKAAGRLRTMMTLLGHYDPINGGRQLNFVPKELRFLNPRKAILVFALKPEYYGPVESGSVDITLESIGRYAAQPWTITDIQNFRLDRGTIFGE